MKTKWIKFLLLTGCLSLASTSYAVEKVVATVNGTPILNSQVKQALGKRANTEANRAAALDDIIDDMLVQKAIKDANINVSQQQIQQIMHQIANENGLTYGQFLDALDYQGIGEAKFRQQIAHQIIMGEVRNKAINESISVSREQIEKLGMQMYNEAKQKGTLQTVKSPQYLVSHILIKTNPLLNDAQAKKQLSDLRSDIIAGKTTFAAAAKSYSKDYLSGANGGSLGWNFPEVYDPEFQAMIKNSKKGVISQPFKTQYGWHILEVVDKREGDKTKEAYMQKAYQQVVNQQAMEASKDWVKTLRKSADIKILQK
ncbi:peptidylprolyl isomerase [Gallibacterium anatis]|uniref:Peptidylprolyl isomerase n=1 Tax=Gallibacterium genomosp. 1 TaxID=155515 RepID=A0A0A2Y7W1_9PAST|nr:MULTISPECIES: peptidylprolyl isomerase [Gallibacterium]KGQ39217.1 peptidylprolyl isomerase [Gallibacterium genomosp. 1]MDK9561256.1 peptidylprolyl isomerase [Gallibacterium anatis]